jgi:hypothetical protein
MAWRGVERSLAHGVYCIPPHPGNERHDGGGDACATYVLIHVPRVTPSHTGGCGSSRGGALRRMNEEGSMLLRVLWPRHSTGEGTGDAISTGRTASGGCVCKEARLTFACSMASLIDLPQ